LGFRTRSLRSAVSSALRFSRTVRRASRGGVRSLLGRLEFGHDLVDGAPRDLAAELGHLAVDHLDGRLPLRAKPTRNSQLSFLAPRRLNLFEVDQA
jgi:hypothetical protein